jgi:hypothetical protein
MDRTRLQMRPIKEIEQALADYRSGRLAAAGRS